MYYLYKIQCIMSTLKLDDALESKDHLNNVSQIAFGEDVKRNDTVYIISEKDIDSLNSS